LRGPSSQKRGEEGGGTAGSIRGEREKKVLAMLEPTKVLVAPTRKREEGGKGKKRTALRPLLGGKTLSTSRRKP